MISAIAILAGMLHSSAECKIPLYVQTSSIPSSHKEQFYISLKDAITFWNDQSPKIGFELVGDSYYEANSNAATISWSNDSGEQPKSIANTYLLYDSNIFIKRARVNLLYKTHWCSSYNTDLSSCYDMTNSLEHELGHVFGLTHTTNAEDLMKAEADFASRATHELSKNDKERFEKIIARTSCRGSSTTFVWR